MTLAGVGRLLRRLPGALDALQRHAHLCFAGWFRLFLHRMAIAVSAGEIHPAVDAGGIALQHLLNQADALEELAPIEGRDQTQAANQVGHEGLFGGLMSSFRPDCVLDGLADRSQRIVELVPELARRRAPLARALQHADDERRVQLLWPEPGRQRSGIERAGQAVGVLTMGAADGENVGAGPQVLDQRKLEGARPGPQFADGQRSDRLKGGDEPVQPLCVEMSGTSPDQLEGHREHARLAGRLVGGDLWQLLVEGGRQIVMNVADRSGNDVEVVQQPLGGGR